MITEDIWERILEQVEQDRPYLLAFSRERNVRLEDISVTTERAPKIPFEAMYFFDDGLGGYTIDGIKNHLDPLYISEDR